MEMSVMIRLDKYLADMGAGTRTEVKKLIRQGQITVDGEVVKKPEMKVKPGENVITCLGKEMAYQEFEYFMLYKPAGVISATEDKKETTVVDLIEEKSRKDLFPVGRLDRDTEGLLLITNDGMLAHELLSPKKHVSKVYYARVKGCVNETDILAFLEGVDIGEKLPTMPAKLTILHAGEESEITLEIQEGKFHQVKRMFEAVGKEVVYLKRLSMGSLVLDQTLKAGEYRRLSKKELDELCCGIKRQ